MVDSELPALLTVLQSDGDQEATGPLKCLSCRLAELERKKWASVNRRQMVMRREKEAINSNCTEPRTCGIMENVSKSR